MDGLGGWELEREITFNHSKPSSPLKPFITVIMQPVFAMMMRVILRSTLVIQVEEIALKHLKD